MAIMSIEKSILQSIQGKFVVDSKINDNNVLTLIFKDGGKIVLHVNMSKGVDYIAAKTKPNVKLDRAKKFAESALKSDDDKQTTNRFFPKDKKIKVKLKSKEKEKKDE